jgi:CopG antitoxin of type II toxin-antitoxin system
MKQSLTKVPKFKDEEAERAFWASHDSADYLDWKAARAVSLPRLEPAPEAISTRRPAGPAQKP